MIPLLQRSNFKGLSALTFGAALFFVGVFVYVPTVYASTLVGQTSDFATQQHTTGGFNDNRLEQPLGTGLSGAPYYLYFKYSDSVPGVARWYIKECSDSSYSSCTYMGDPGLAPTSRFFSTSTPSGSNLSGYLTIASSSVSFSPSKYYLLVQNTTDSNIHFLGSNATSSSSAFTSRALFTGDGTGEGNDSIKSLYFALTDVFGIGVVPVNSIFTVNPVYGSVAATSTSFVMGATGYIKDSDYVSGAFLSIDVVNRAGSTASTFPLVGLGLTSGNPRCLVGVLAWCLFSSNGTLDQVVSLPITASGAFSVSTSTFSITQIGVYQVNWAIQVPQTILGIAVPGFYTTLVASTTQFTASTTSFADSIQIAIAQAVASSTAGTSLAGVQKYCNIFIGFDMISCLTSLLLPSSADISNAMTGLYNGLLDKWPLGYLTRPLAILDGGVATSSANLPSLAFTLPSNANLPAGVGGTSLDLSPWGHLLGAGSYISSATSSGSNPQTFSQIVRPKWEQFCYFAFGIVLILEILGLLGRVNTGGGRGSRAPTDQEIGDWYSKKYNQK